MSDLGAQLDRLAVIAGIAIPGIVTERGSGIPEKLLPQDLPHLYLSDPEEQIELLAHQQERVTAALNLLFVTRGDTQEQLLAKIDTFRSNLAFDPTLAGLVIAAWISSLGIEEHPEKNLKLAQVVVGTLRERF